MKSFIKRHLVENGFHTHVSMVSPRGKFAFNRSNLDKLFELYNYNMKLGIAEKPQEYMPVLVDIDIKKEDEGENTLYTEEHVKSVIVAYQKTLKEIIDDNNDKTLQCILLTKPSYKINKNGKTFVKHGFHLHFPHCFMSKMNQKNHLIPRVKKIIKDKKTFSDLGIEDSSTVIDDCIGTVPWLLYGSVKEEGKDPYLISKYYDHNSQETTIEEVLKDYKIYDSNEVLINVNDDIDRYLPKILSIIPYGREVIELKNNLSDPNEKHNIKHKPKRNKTFTNNLTLNDQQRQAKQLINIISCSRADDRMDWLKVGWILNSIFQGDNDGLTLWCEFSERCSDKYDEDVCTDTWEKMEDKGHLTLGTLHYWAKIDNPTEYKKLLGSKDFDHETHKDIADFFKKEYGDHNIRIVDKKNGDFYHWNEKTLLWDKEPQVSLITIISEFILPILAEKRDLIFSKLHSTDDKAEQAMYNARLKTLIKSINNMKTLTFVNNVVRWYASFHINTEFENNLDRNPSELPLKEGLVINLKNSITRKRTRLDLYTTELQVNYTPDSTFENAIKFFRSISCDDIELVDYHRRLWGYCLTGEITDRSLHVCWGEGRNGKSTLMNIMEKIMGKYCTALSEAVMMRQERSGGATPELMALRYSRLGLMPESENEEVLNSKRVKSITGADIIKARALYCGEIEFRTQTKPIMPTNHKPVFNINDQAMIDRVKLVPFNARFPTIEENEEEAKKNTFFINHLMENCIDEIFTWLVTGAKDWYDGNNLIPCPVMKTEMESYIEELDVVKAFINETYDTKSKEEYKILHKEEKKNWFIKKDMVYAEFVCWSQCQREKPIGKKEFNKNVAKHLTTIQSKGMRCYICKKKEDDGYVNVSSFNGGPPM